jgi:predicted dehydrogenase
MLRYAIIGSGMMGHEHIRNIQLLGDAMVTAVADPDEAMRNTSVALTGGTARSFADHRSLLDSGLADVLVIASPNYTHTGLLFDAMTSGLPILIEKPLCTQIEDCEKIERAVRDYKAPVWVGMEYRYMPPVRKLIEGVCDGRIGSLMMLSIIEHRFPFLRKVNNWNRFSEYTGGTLVEKCCHFFDLMRLVTNSEATKVFASSSQAVNHLDESYENRVPDIDDNAFVIVEFESGVRGALHLCMFAEGSYFQEEICVIGDVAKLEARVPGPARFWPGGRERESEVVLSPRFQKEPVTEKITVDDKILAAGDHHGSTFYQHQRFRDSVLNGNPVEVSVEDAVKAIRIGLAAQQSIHNGQAIDLI